MSLYDLYGMESIVCAPFTISRDDCIWSNFIRKSFPDSAPNASLVGGRALKNAEFILPLGNKDRLFQENCRPVIEQNHIETVGVAVDEKFGLSFSRQTEQIDTYLAWTVPTAICQHLPKRSVITSSQPICPIERLRKKILPLKRENIILIFISA